MVGKLGRAARGVLARKPTKMRSASRCLPMLQSLSGVRIGMDENGIRHNLVDDIWSMVCFVDLTSSLIPIECLYN